jgi:hypothetical protein
MDSGLAASRQSGLTNRRSKPLQNLLHVLDLRRGRKAMADENHFRSIQPPKALYCRTPRA